MFLERLELVDFRGYAHARVELGPGVRVFVGANAQGKTNLLEAVHYLAIGASHRVASDVPLIRRVAGGSAADAPSEVGPAEAEAIAAVIRAVARVGAVGPVDPAADRGRRLTVELELRPSGRNRARVNDQPQPRIRDAIGQMRSVLFAPEDVGLVRGDPSDRRRFLDELLAQRRPAYLAARQEYERVLRQRNALLRAMRAGGEAAGATLATWTEALVNAGATLIAARIAAVHALAGPVAEAYADLVVGSPEREAAADVALAYELSTSRVVPAEPSAGVPDPAALAEELAKGLAAVAPAERERGITLAGPHRDELQLSLNGLPARGYASHGETWSLALALRLASREVLGEVGEEPVVLLDDVFAELDERRRARLAARCASFQQVLVTAAVDDDVPLAGPRHRVEAGTITTNPVAAGREGW
ncbi:MAG: DNA replication/repair protein RecF [Egibacteraceae bacterium]